MKNTRKIKLTISDTAPLYPPLWGGPKRIWNLFSNFSKEQFDITYVGVDVSLKRNYQVKRIADNIKSITVKLPPHYYPWYAFEKKLIRNTTFDLFAYLMMKTDKHFSSILDLQEADVVVASHPWSSPCMKKKKDQLFIYDAHNCEYLLMKQILDGSWYRGIVSNWTKSVEQDACAKSDLLFVCSQKEKEDFQRIYNINPNIFNIVPNGAYLKDPVSFDEKKQAKESLGINNQGKVVVFVGAHYKPNNDAVWSIIKKIAPACGDIIFLIVGSVANEFVDVQVPHNIKFTGLADEGKLDLALKATDIAINPMMSGSGINIKMLDYMAYGLPIVTTECGARGINTEGLQPMTICFIDEFPAVIKAIFSNPERVDQMSNDGRRVVEQFYDWRILSHECQKIIEKMLQ